ncbi:hypothetical protein VY88_26080 [Azospirillum thiophilum]|uniref:ABC transporter substrate-binding protein n=1 Tax=Azospirillum thiophilum TaxID=528244 RepID=A0AAC8W4J7_9PROT|nr:DUF2076 domain-containing protein [Azospirillum thiophilum]ALG75019.1 hypothetical protein AL072_29000 [Azospirillum thiophilum]KJR62408.1 hypothetical protein VY88_26080 [Azospirillum thiophilum]
MTPEERTLLSDLFRRLREAEAQPRDAEAEDFIRRSVQDQPLSAYYMAQTVLVQQQALTAAQTRIEELERQARDRADRPASTGGSFLSNALGIGRSPWSRGGEQPAAPPPAGRSPWSAPPNAPTGIAAPGYGQPGAAYPQQPYPQQPFPQAGMAPRGGGFFAGAAQTAAGVAGGMLAASAISSLLHHSPGPFGEAVAQTPTGETTVNETVVNNYYGDDRGAPPEDAARDVSYDQDQPAPDDAPFDDGGGSGGDDSWI